MSLYHSTTNIGHNESCIWLEKIKPEVKIELQHIQPVGILNNSSFLFILNNPVIEKPPVGNENTLLRPFLSCTLDASFVSWEEGNVSIFARAELKVAATKNVNNFLNDPIIARTIYQLTLVKIFIAAPQLQLCDS